MGAFCKLVDSILFFFFLIIAIVAPLIDAQTCLPQHLFPSFLVELKSWYATEYGDYLISEKPHFFVGIVWLQLLFQWPLAIACLYGIAAGRSWLNTTCLIYGVSVFTSMVPTLSEMALSNRASDKLMMIYFPFLGFGLLAFLRGLTTKTVKSVTIGRRPAINQKKRA
ncbi:hypothetical protein F511_01515 [Dorcoceras hygrometricum]|nr:hypothetical protein F511_01515 [Dorcoceras hygrometricum]